MSKHTIASLDARLTIAEHSIELLLATQQRNMQRIAQLEDAKPQAHSFRTALGVALAAAPDGVRRAAYFRAHPQDTHVSKIEVDVWCAEL
jgi:hypothetical protein